MTRLGEGKKFVEPDWKRRLAYSLVGEPHVPGWIRLNHVIRQINALLLNGRAVKVLDAGSGRGDLLNYLAERHPSWQCTGIEVLPERIEKAQTISNKLGLKNVRYQQGDICNLPFENEFDIAVCLDVLEHIEDDVAAFNSITRALKPGGCMILTSPSNPQPKHLWTVAWRERRVGFDPSEYGHVRDGYSRELMAELLEKSGAKPVNVRFTYGKPGTLAFDIFFSIGDNRPNPILFAGLYPVMKFLGWLDLHVNPKHGAAVMAIGQKPLNGHGGAQ